MKKVSNIEYIIPINGLSTGKHSYSFTIGNSFFEEYESSEIFGADLEISLTLDRHTTFIDIKANFEGSVITECDRCLGNLELEVDFTASMVVKFVKTDQQEEESESEEVVLLDPSESDLDFKQFFYDYICLALPIQRVHKEEEECDPKMLEKIKNYAVISDQEIKESPFDKLKNLMN